MLWAPSPRLTELTSAETYKTEDITVQSSHKTGYITPLFFLLNDSFTWHNICLILKI